MHNRTSPICHGSMIARMPLLKEPCQSDEMDIAFQIHKIEKEAYCSVLRAFIAQSDLLSWSKEGLMTELRKELNVTDSEHGQLLVEIKSDESIKKIKEWQKGAHESLSSTPYIATTPSVLPAHFRGDRRIVSGNSAKYVKIGDHNIQGPPCNRGGSVQPQLKQGYQAPDYGNFKSCVKFVDHNIQEPPNSREEAVQSQMTQGYQEPDSGNFRVRMKIVEHNSQGPVSNRAVPPQYQLKNKTQAPDAGDFKHCSEVIEIRITDEVIHQVEAMTSGASNFDPVQIGKAKLILSVHESSILEALNKLADVSDEDESVYPQHYSYEAVHGNGCRMLANYESLREAGRRHGFFREGFHQTHPVRIDE